MGKNFRVLNLFWALGCLVFFISLPLRAQTLFQNNNVSCEDLPVIGYTFGSIVENSIDGSITCGPFNDDSALGEEDFPDCATVADAIPSPLPSTPNPLTNSILINTGAHGQNCVNAGEPNNQFSPPDFLSNSDLVPSTDESRMGTIVNGNLNQSEFNDLAMVFAFDPDDFMNGSFVEELFNTGNDFGPPLSSDTISLEDMALIPPLLPFPLNDSAGPIGGGINFGSERSMALLNCDDDPVDEAVVAVLNREPVTDNAALVVLQNLGSGLETGSAPINTTITTDDFMRATVAAADFDNDETQDIAMAVSTRVTNNTSDPSVVICKGGPDCSFDCSMPENIIDLCLAPDCTFTGSNNIDPTSIVAGDFDGKGRMDIAVADRISGEVSYFFNNGGAPNTWPRLSVPFPNPSPNIPEAPIISVLTVGRFTVTAIQQNIDELAFTVLHGAFAPPFRSTVEVLTTDGNHGINGPISLSLLPDASLDTQFFLGIDAKDFDHCGGDDIIALNSGEDASINIVGTDASLFLNTNEPPTVTIGPGLPTELDLDTPFNVTATCTDPTFDQRDFQWSVVNSPPGSGVVFGTPSGTVKGKDSNVSTTFTANKIGDYTIEVSCTDFCGLTDTDPDHTTVTFNVIPVLTQGGCLGTTLNPDAAPHGAEWLWVILMLLPAWPFLRTRRSSTISL